MNKKRDYTRYSKETVSTTEPVEVVDSKTEIPAVVEVDDIPVTVTPAVVEVEESEPIIGVVTDCIKLNVREQADSTAEILGIISASTELVIIEEESTNDFYKICTSAGLEGYCMKKFITIIS